MEYGKTTYAFDKESVWFRIVVVEEISCPEYRGHTDSPTKFVKSSESRKTVFEVSADDVTMAAFERRNFVQLWLGGNELWQRNSEPLQLGFESDTESGRLVRWNVAEEPRRWFLKSIALEWGTASGATGSIPFSVSNDAAPYWCYWGQLGKLKDMGLGWGLDGFFVRTERDDKEGCRFAKEMFRAAREEKGRQSRRRWLPALCGGGC